MIQTSKNILHSCECGCETPVIEETTYDDGYYRVVCPDCKNGEDTSFANSLEACIRDWNDVRWRWDIQTQKGESR